MWLHDRNTKPQQQVDPFLLVADHITKVLRHFFLPKLFEFWSHVKFTPQLSKWAETKVTSGMSKMKGGGGTAGCYPMLTSSSLNPIFVTNGLRGDLLTVNVRP